MTPLPILTQTAYAELLDQLTVLDAQRSIGHAPGTFITKTIRERTYFYFQYSTPEGGTKQAYVGPARPELAALVRRFARERDAIRADRERILALSAMLRAGGAATTDASSARVIGALANAGVFKLGGVLVGTHAFLVLGNVLGVRWTGGHDRTDDIDPATTRTLEIAVPELEANIPSALENLGMGFLPVPGFSPKHPSTSFHVRRRGLRLDLVTPAKTGRNGVDGPIPIPRFNAAAAPVRYLDYAIEDAATAAVVNGGGILVRVPEPARFAIHKLLVAQDRPVTFQTKSRKDLAQAAALIEALEELRPGDLPIALAHAKTRGQRWIRALNAARKLLAHHYPHAAALLA
ncbi:MAG: GSU2403 family nucleotidyltransferase fold protein [Polyangiaceae bacterium]|nr:GSU2403 family nucleotidyltransferase fold protein [Polyangiaceae bacterium]